MNSIEITGPITQPESRFTPQNKQVLSFRINATEAEKDKVTGQWDDVGAPLWVTVNLWEHDAERYASLGKGDRVTVEGGLFVEEYQKHDGSMGTGFKLRFPRMKGVVPRHSENAAQSAPPSFQQGSYGTPPSDPWATSGGPQQQAFNEQPPF